MQQRHDQSRHESAADLRVTNARLCGGDDQIARGHQPGAAGNGRAMDRRDGDLWRLINCPQHPRHQPGSPLAILRCKGFLQIKPRAKDRAFSPQDQHPLGLVLREGFKGGRAFLHEGAVERVALGGTVQGHKRDALLQLLRCN